MTFGLVCLERKSEVKIRDPDRVPGSIPEFNKWGSGIDPRNLLWDWSLKPVLWVIPESCSGIDPKNLIPKSCSRIDPREVLYKIPEFTNYCSGICLVLYSITPRTVILRFRDRSRNTIFLTLGSIPENKFYFLGPIPEGYFRDSGIDPGTSFIEF